MPRKGDVRKLYGWLTWARGTGTGRHPIGGGGFEVAHLLLGNFADLGASVGDPGWD
jgi:hypothetical protein